MNTLLTVSLLLLLAIMVIIVSIYSIYEMVSYYFVLIPKAMEKVMDRQIKKMAQNLKISKEEANERWETYCSFVKKLANENGIDEFKCLYAPPSYENLMSGSCWNGYIYLYPRLFQCIISRDKNWMDVANAVVAHELGHIKYSNSTNLFSYPSSLKMLKGTIHEVQADFAGAKFLNITPKEYAKNKSKMYDTFSEKKCDKVYRQSPHPSPNQRIEYLTNYEVFDIRLVKKIVEDAAKKRKKNISFLDYINCIYPDMFDDFDSSDSSQRYVVCRCNQIESVIYKDLKPGEIYEVEKVIVDSSQTFVYLKEFPELKISSLYFKEMKKLHII